jgi:ABC-type multidrug transport system fused ATPase/permease subunit
MGDLDGPITVRQVLTAQWRIVLAAMVVSLVGAAVLLLQPLVVRGLLATPGDGARVMRIATLIGGLLFLDAIVGGVQSYLLARAGEDVVMACRIRVSAHALRLPVSHYTTTSVGDALSRVTADTGLLRVMATRSMVDLVHGVVVTVGAVIGMLLVDPLLLGLAAVAVALVVVIAIGASAPVRRQTTAMQEELGHLSTRLERALRAIRTIRVAGAEPRELAAITRSARTVRNAGTRAGLLFAVTGPTVSITVQTGVVLVLGFGALRVQQGHMALGNLVAFALLLMFMIGPLVRTGQSIAEIQSGLGALRRLNEILRCPVEEDRTARGVVIRRAPPPVPVLDVRDVHLNYPGDTEPVPALRGVSFTAAAGTTTAIVGRSGAGKSSLLSLLVRLYDVDAGRILLHGRDVTTLPRSTVRGMIGYVEQDAPVLDGSLRDNLVLGGTLASDAELAEALRAVGLGYLADRHADGLHAPVGQAGALLSGGERQRLAIARALLRRPALLLLDEPTASLDTLNESLVQRAWQPLASGGTAVVVAAHRLSTVVGADNIVVLDEGRVVGTGTHGELLERCELYRGLVGDTARRAFVAAE